MKKLIVAFIILTIVYLNVSLWFWEMNPSKWSMSGRIAYSLICALIGIFYEILTSKEETEDENEEF